MLTRRKNCQPPKIQTTAKQSKQTTRNVSKGTLANRGSSTINKNSFVEDAIRVWNEAPDSIKTAKSLYSAKIEIKKFCKALPI